jgi:hypothetical protein
MPSMLWMQSMLISMPTELMLAMLAPLPLPRLRPIGPRLAPTRRRSNSAPDE